MSRVRYYKFDVICKWCGSDRGARRYGFQWVCIRCEERDENNNLVPYDERMSDWPLYRSQGGKG